MDALAKKRTFQVWEYRVSHGSLLIRSPIREGVSTNLDLMFVGVEYMALPRYLRGLKLVEPSGEEVAEVSRLLSKEVPPERIWIIASQGQRFPIVAVGSKMTENTSDIFDSPFDLGNE